MKLFSLQHIFTYSQFFVFHVLFVIVIAAYKNIATVMSTYPRVVTLYNVNKHE